MLALPVTNSWGFVYTNAAIGDVAPGTSVIPGTSGAEGSWTEIGPDASITSNIGYTVLSVTDGFSSAVSKLHLLDFGWDPAGGTSYVPFFSDLACGGSILGSQVSRGREFHFPCMIPSGSAIAVRAQGSHSTAGTIKVLANFYGKASRPELWRNAAYSETLGYTSGTLGTSFTPGTGAFGSWVSLGTTAKKHFWAQLGMQIDNATQAGTGVRVQCAIGDGTNFHNIIDTHLVSDTNERCVSGLQTPCTWEIPSGATLYVRGAASAAPATGYNATAVLFGG